MSSKRPAISKRMIEFHEKRAKLDIAAQSSITAVYYGDVKPRSSKDDQSIKMEDNQSMANAQPEETTSSYYEQSTEQYNQTLSLPPVDVHIPAKDTNIDGEGCSQATKQPDQTNGGTSQTSIFSNKMAVTMTAPKLLTTTEQKSQPQIADVRSIATVYKDHEQSMHNDFSYNEASTSQHLQKMPARLYSQIAGARRLVPIQPPVERKLRILNVERKMTMSAQNPSNLMNQPLKDFAISSSSPNIRRSHDVSAVDPRVLFQNFDNVASSSQNLSSSQQRPSLVRRLESQTMCLQSTVQRLKESQTNNQRTRLVEHSFTENNNHDYRPNIQTISMRTTQKQPKRPKIRIGINITPKSNSQNSTLQGVTKKTPSHILSKVLNSIRKALSSTHNDYLLKEQQLQASLSVKSNEHNSTGLATGPENIAASATRDIHHSEIPTCSFYQTPRTELTSAHEDGYENLRTQKQSTETNSHIKQMHFKDEVDRSLVMEIPPTVMDNTYGTDECMIENSLYHGVTSNSDAVMDHEISNYDITTDKTPAETINDFYRTRIDTGSSSADRPTSALSSTPTTHQMDSRVVMERQMLDHFAILFSQMGSTLQNTCDMYNNLRGSILEIAESYKKLLDTVERFNTELSASNVSPSSDVIPEVQQAAEERPVEVTATEKKHNNLWRFVLPPKYDRHDSRWTLKYRKNMPGLVELMPQSRIYVSYGELKYCQKKSKDCKSLARRLFQEVFNRDALSVCASMTEKGQASNNVGSNVRPGLDEHANTTLLNFVIEYGAQCGWNTDLEPILSTLHRKIQEIRFKYGLMVKI